MEYVELGFTTSTMKPVPTDGTMDLLDTFNVDTTPKDINLYAEGE